MVTGGISTTDKNSRYESTTDPDSCLYRKSERKGPSSATKGARQLFFFLRPSTETLNGLILFPSFL
jgi:hypothetical protein